ncbi:MAG: carboxypeptidase [Desulfobacteraceae bacterium 4572_130]|nr:MAG: carboxypeptidase [Desulfobacteraceae bacterium 4572_130]
MNLFTRIFNFLKFFFYSLSIIIACLCVVISLMIFTAAKNLPKLPHPLSKIIETPGTEIYAATGEKLITLGAREPIALNKVSPDFINAVLAIEDHRFFEHHGINKLRTIKALFITFLNPKKIQGASTITQQLAKNLFFSFKPSYLRKFKELLLSFQIESTCTKQEILHAYINQIYFGKGAQGIKKAARVFFGISASDLSLEQASLLAGILKSPTNYNPYKYYEKALKRREIVLKRMAETGYITYEEKKNASQTFPELNSFYKNSRPESYFIDTVINFLVKKYSEDVVFHGGIKIFTTLDLNLQSSAEQSIKTGLENLDNILGIKKHEKILPQAALVTLDTGTGAVKAMVGGRNYLKTEFNRAVNSFRQPGSGFKPFLYYAALKEFNLTGATQMTDKNVIIPIKGAPEWNPKNFNKKNTGEIIIKKAFTYSVNSIAAQLVEMTGPELVIETAKSCGIKSPLNNVYSIALGTSPVSPLEMAAAFSTFATNGIRHEPFFIWRVENSFGRVIYEHLVKDKKVLNPEIAFQILDMMRSVVDTGTGKIIRKNGFINPAAGKTGTTDNYNDAWFTGFTPSLCTSVWTGFDKKRNLKTLNNRGITGGRGAAPIWADFMKKALVNEPIKKFIIPEKIKFKKVDSKTGCKPLNKKSLTNEKSLEIYKIPLKQNQLICRTISQEQKKYQEQEK